MAATFYVINLLTVALAWGPSEGLSIKLPGDIILGGLFPVHVKGERSPCGSAIYHRGIQRLEAMLFALDQINQNATLLPGIWLGATVVDTCSRDTYALNRSLEFIRASLNSMDPAGFECIDGSVPKVRPQGYGPVFGVVGGSYSSVSIQVANLLRLFRIPQISPASTAKVLSDKSRYEFFARTVPPDDYQAITMVDIVEKFNWTYVSTVASEGSYGESGIEVFHREAGLRNICIAIFEKVPSSADDRTFDNIVSSLYRKRRARVVVLFTRADDARGILAAAKRLHIKGHFIWVASDGWGRQHKLVEGLEDVAEGAITVDLQSEIVPGFDQYMFSLTPYNNKRNPWFEDFWQEIFNCVLPHHASADHHGQKHRFTAGTRHNLSVCSPNLQLNYQVGYEQDSKIQFVIDAVYSFAHALAALHADVCGTKRGPCPALLSYDGGDFYQNYLLNVSFTDSAGSEVKFDSRGDGLARYTIMNYRRLPNSSGYDYAVIGKWFNTLQLDPGDVKWTNETADVPPSVCSLPCNPGEVKITLQGDSCCWTCDICDPWEYVENEFKCADCGAGRWPFADKRGCFDLELQYMTWNSLMAIIPLCVACVGILLTLTVIALFIKHSQTPIVKASGRELSFMLLCGILLCYADTFALLAKPTTITCAVQRLGVGLGFSSIYGSLLTKTNRISRIFNAASHTAKRPSFISPKSQVAIASCLISLQAIGTLLWMLVEPPGTRNAYPQRDQAVLKCRTEDSSFLLSQSYNVLLIIICTVYAVKTRKIPENFNESKFIGFTMYTTCIIWLAFLPIYFGTANTNEIQITTMCLTISLSATVALVCLFSPKIYIIVFHPDKNVRKLTMHPNNRKPVPAATQLCSSSGHGTTKSTMDDKAKLEVVQQTNHTVTKVADSENASEHGNGTLL